MVSQAHKQTVKRRGHKDALPAEQAPQPGVVLIFTAGQPILRAIPFADRALQLGREHPALESIPDELMSRLHATLTHDGQVFRVTDNGSSNGTAVDGEPVPAHRAQVVQRVVRLGDSLFVVVPDLRPFVQLGVVVHGQRVLGPVMQTLQKSVAHIAQHGTLLHITGESGVGKEAVARAFHDASTRAKGRFIAVNCATIAEGIAERLLFGTKRGAFSGADADADGYVQAADGGTLFLDEVAELSLAVQAKLLRVLESKEIVPVGATRPKSVTLGICSATHKDLRAEVAAQRLREDLYFRIASPQVTIPPLRQRLEEIPWLLQAAVQAVSPKLQLDASLVETCLLRPWPGNVRELLYEARCAAQAALATAADRVEGIHLGRSAGQTFASTTPATADLAPAQPTATPPDAQSTPAPDRAAITAALARADGNVSAAARQLGVHRTQMYRWIARYGIVTS